MRQRLAFKQFPWEVALEQEGERRGNGTEKESLPKFALWDWPPLQATGV